MVTGIYCQLPNRSSKKGLGWHFPCYAFPNDKKSRSDNDLCLNLGTGAQSQACWWIWNLPVRAVRTVHKDSGGDAFRSVFQIIFIVVFFSSVDTQQGLAFSSCSISHPTTALTALRSHCLPSQRRKVNHTVGVTWLQKWQQPFPLFSFYLRKKRKKKKQSEGDTARPAVFLLPNCGP